jgi:integral membrane sensor domain MASE1
MKRSPVLLLSRILLLAILYFAAARLGLSLASLHKNVTPVWPPTGIAIAALLIYGRRLWPGIFIGALAVNALTDIPLGSAVGIATGNTLEAIAACWLLQRVARWRNSLDSVADVMRFVACATVLAPIVSATSISMRVRPA